MNGMGIYPEKMSSKKCNENLTHREFYMDIKEREKRLLIIDDDLISRFGIRTMLENSGFLVEEAENGQLGIDKFFAKKTYYDVVLVDYNMPDMNGAMVTKELRRIEENSDKNILIIGITANLDPVIKAICMRAGMNSIISKPIDINKIKNLLQNFNNQKVTI